MNLQPQSLTCYWQTDKNILGVLHSAFDMLLVHLSHRTDALPQWVRSFN